MPNSTQDVVVDVVLDSDTDFGLWMVVQQPQGRGRGRGPGATSRRLEHSIRMDTWQPTGTISHHETPGITSMTRGGRGTKRGGKGGGTSNHEGLFSMQNDLDMIHGDLTVKSE